MGYANQLIGGGDGEAVLRRLAAAGTSGVIVADLTPDEGAPFEAVAREAGLAVIYLIAPTTTPERRAVIAARTGGFLYCVSLVGVTGARSELSTIVASLVRDARAVARVPLAVGFGISTPEHVRAVAATGADGVVVASALVDALGDEGRDLDAFNALAEELRAATLAPTPPPPPPPRPRPPPGPPRARTGARRCRRGSRPAGRRQRAGVREEPTMSWTWCGQSVPNRTRSAPTTETRYCSAPRS